MPEGQRVMLKLSIPAKAGLFEPLIGHPKVLRVVALSGGFSREEACRELARNPGMIASFSRALLSDLRAQQSDEEFNRRSAPRSTRSTTPRLRKCRPDRGRSRVRPDRLPDAEADGAGEALPHQPAGRRRALSGQAQGRARAWRGERVPAARKEVEEHELARLAEPLQRICADADVAFIVNDSMQLAKRLGADGVHLGQSDGDIREARALLGPSAQIGKTCHDSRHFAMEAGEAGADYVAFGAFYPTTTKPSHYRPPPSILDLVVGIVRNPLRGDRRDHAGERAAAGRCRRRLHRRVPGGLGKGDPGKAVAESERFSPGSSGSGRFDIQRRWAETRAAPVRNATCRDSLGGESVRCNHGVAS